MKLVLSSLLVVAVAAGSASAFQSTTTRRTPLSPRSPLVRVSVRTLSGRRFAAQTEDDFRGSNNPNNNPNRPPPRYPPPPPSNPNNPQAQAAQAQAQAAQAQAQAAEVNRVRSAYMEWCRNYGKTFEEPRLPIFADNFLRMENYAQQTGEQVQFNEYADLTTDEYKYILASQQQQQQQQMQRQQQQQPQRQGRGRPPTRSPQRPSSSSPRSAAPLPVSGWRRGLAETNPKGYETLLKVVTLSQTAIVGAVIGTLCVLPVTAFHYLSFQDYSYTTYAQWEWDLIAASIQAALFANVYRTSIGRDFDNTTVTNRLLAAFIIVKSLVRISVGPDCASYSFLYCAEPFYIVDDQMALTLLVNLAESIALFYPVATVLRSLLQDEKIAPYDGYE
jgi:hypothetical protein